MKNLKGIVSVLSNILKYAPIIIVVVEALTMIKEAVEKLSNNEKISGAGSSAPALDAAKKNDGEQE